MRSATNCEKEHITRAIEWGHSHGLSLNGLYYNEELAGPEGASFQIFVTKETNNETIERAIEQMRNECDVVNFRVVRVPAEWISEVVNKIKPSGDIIDKVIAIDEGTCTNHRLTWADKSSVHLDPTTARLLAKVFAAMERETQEKIRKVANMSAQKFQRVVDLAWKCVH